MIGMKTEVSRQTGGWVPSDTFATRLLVARTQKGMTQQQAADACDINRATWALWEAGSSPRNMAVVVAKIATGLGVDRDWLLWGGPLREPSGPGRGPGLLSHGESTDRYVTLSLPRQRDRRHVPAAYVQACAA